MRSLERENVVLCYSLLWIAFIWIFYWSLGLDCLWVVFSGYVFGVFLGGWRVWGFFCFYKFFLFLIICYLVFFMEGERILFEFMSQIYYEYLWNNIQYFMLYWVLKLYSNYYKQILFLGLQFNVYVCLCVRGKMYILRVILMWESEDVNIFFVL